MNDNSPDIPLKKCSTCPQEKPDTIEFFYPGRKQCKECISKQGKAYYTTHKEQHQAFMQTYYLAHKDEYQERAIRHRKKHPDAGRRRTATYRLRHPGRATKLARDLRNAHPERQKRYDLTYRLRHPDRRPVTSLKYRLKHRDHMNVHRRNYYARKQQAQGRHTAQDIQVQYDRQKGKCYYCHAKLGKEKHQYHVDHVIPLSRGGSNGPDNLVIACPSCNSSKHNSLPHEWPKGGRLL